MTKTDLHRLVDELPDSAVSLATRLLAAVRDEADPLLSLLENAPVDDEPVTPEEEAAIEEALEDVRAGRLVPHEEVWRRLESER
jgi:predicted transcriptional regulator